MVSPLRIFFFLAFALTWGIGGIALLIGSQRPELHPLSTSSPLYYLAGYSVSVAGVALTAAYAGRAGLRSLGSRLIPWRSPLRWYLVIGGGYAAITGIALLFAILFHPPSVVIPQWTWLLTGLPLTIIKDPGPLGEEFGWRGFALPWLLDRFSPFEASIRLGLIHTAWHLPLFFIPGLPQTQFSFPFFMLGVLAIAIFDTALYLHARANLLLAILVHLFANVCGGFALHIKALNAFYVAEGIAAAVVIVLGGLRTIGRPRPAISDAPVA